MANTNHTATEAYEERQKDIGALIGCIQMELEAVETTTRNEGIDWGDVGSLGHVKEQLKDILMFLMNADSEEEFERLIEGHLEDLKV